MNRKLIVVLLATVGLTAGVAVAEPTGVSSGARNPSAASPATGSRRPLQFAETTLSTSGEKARIALDSPVAAGSGQPDSPPVRAHRNSPHPAVLSHSQPVYPTGVPLPPVSLERY